jgi:hypothetical protein
MPLNYLELEPQITQYAQSAVELNRELAEKLDIALKLIHDCGQRHGEKKDLISQAIKAQSDPPRCALIAHEPADQSYECGLASSTPYTLLASDGSQISPSGHDAVSIALINTSRICFRQGSGSAPEIIWKTSFLFDEEGRFDLGQMSDDLVALRRDMAEMEILGMFDGNPSDHIVALGDGPIELFHQPRQGENFEKFFKDYLDMLKAIQLKGMALAGYTDRPRAALVSRMLEFSVPSGEKPDLAKLEDQAIFKRLLAPGDRSAIFELRSTASPRYEDDLALYFFYLNVGSAGKPWIARVEIPRWAAEDSVKTSLVQRALLDQCTLMNTRPYPYILHRAHEEAVVRFEEKERLVERISNELSRHGLGLSQPSNKQSAKDLGARRRIGQ